MTPLKFRVRKSYFTEHWKLKLNVSSKRKILICYRESIKSAGNLSGRFNRIQGSALYIDGFCRVYLFSLPSSSCTARTENENDANLQSHDGNLNLSESSLKSLNIGDCHTLSDTRVGSAVQINPDGLFRANFCSVCFSLFAQLKRRKT